MSLWWATRLPLLSAGAAALELDNLCVGQWMVSRPIVAGPLFGTLLGAPWEGVAFGALFEALSCESVPAGSHVPFNGCVAVVAAVLLSAGPGDLPAAAAFPAGLAAGKLHALAEKVLRERRAGLNALAEEALAAGVAVPWRRIFLRSLLPHAALTATLLFGAVALGGPILGGLWDALPAALTRGLQKAFDWSLWLGLAVLLDALRRRA
ncbi:MAG: PTS sugar transporter subunit IIC [Elusimicrobiota bacterium]